MFHPIVISDSIDKLAALYNIKPKYYSFPETQEFIYRLKDAVDVKGRPVRELSNEETSFIQNELVLTKCDFKYWAEKYATINVQGTGTSRMYPLLETQQLLVDNIAKLEYEIFTGERTDGILINALKAPRQVGISTLSEVIGSHRATTQANVFGIIAADVPEQSAFMFDMFERVIDNLPWWLLPQIEERVKNSEIKFDSGTSFWVAAGKSVRGQTGQRGNIGRGKTLSFGHLSELSTWDSPDQIDDALLPAIPYSIRSFLLLESTAKGQNNWWHKHWETTKKGHGRFVNIFIPWYIFSRYSKRPPSDWIPKDSTLSTAKRVEDTSPKILHRKVTLTKEQMYYYETTREYHEIKDIFGKFLEEHGAIDDVECFQLAGQSIFSPLVIQKLKDRARPLHAAIEILPKGLIETKHNKSTSPSLVIPPGFGMSALSLSELESRYLLEEYKGLYNLLLVWEPARLGQRYIISVDIGDGIGKDKSVCSVVRVGTIQEPDEQVAQFVSDSLDPMEFAKYCDVIGRYYSDDEGTEALAAVETNNHGLLTQSELQNHLGYNNFYIWKTLDHAKVGGGETNRIGWVTTSRTRPQMLSMYVKKVKSITLEDPLYRLHSPHTFYEMATFITDTTIGEAQADPANSHAHDDCIMAEAIGLMVAHLTHYDEDEDLDSKRNRLAEEKRRQATLAANLQSRRDYCNTDITVEEMDHGLMDYGTNEDWSPN